MTNDKIYQHRFDELLKIIKHDKQFHSINEREDDQIIDVSGNVFREHQKMVSHNESWALYTIEKTVLNIFDQKGIKYTIPEYKVKSPSGKMRTTSPFAFVLKEKRGRIGHVFLYRLRRGLIEIRQDFHKFKGIDGVNFYFLQRNYQEKTDMLNRLEEKEDKSFLRFYQIEDFFNKCFGAQEYSCFIEHVERFNERARTIIGIKSVPIPTNEAVQEFRDKKTNYLKDLDYMSMLPDDIEEDQKKLIVENYIQNNRHMIMNGNAAFADSFISSEWYYGIHTVTGAIDQTGLVTGYLKSVEQLLYALIRLSIDQEIKTTTKRMHIIGAKRKQFPGVVHHNGLIDFIEDNEMYVDTTLGSLIRFVKWKESKKSEKFTNADLFEVNSTTIQSIVDTLYAFKDNERNDRLHEHNLYTNEEVTEVREQAIRLYCLLLGSFEINDTDYTKLMEYDAEDMSISISEEELYDIVIAWTTPILKYDIPEGTNIIAFNVHKWDGMDWDLCLQGLDKIPEKSRKTYKWNYEMTYSSSMTNNRLKWKAEGDYQEEQEKLLRVFRRIISEQSETANMLKKYKEVVVGNMEVIEVLYVK